MKNGDIEGLYGLWILF